MTVRHRHGVIKLEEMREFLDTSKYWHDEKFMADNKFTVEDSVRCRKTNKMQKDEFEAGTGTEIVKKERGLESANGTLHELVHHVNTTHRHFIKVTKRTSYVKHYMANPKCAYFLIHMMINVINQRNAATEIKFSLQA